MLWTVLGIVAGIVAASIAVAVIVGSRLSRDHVAQVRAVYKAPLDPVWARLADPLSAASWRKDVKKIEKVPDINGHLAWREEASFGPATYELIESVERVSRTIRIADDSLPFGGTWEFRVSPMGSGTELTITERGFVKPPIFRFMARYFFGYTSTLEDYLRNLGASLGEQVATEVVASGK